MGETSQGSFIEPGFDFCAVVKVQLAFSGAGSGVLPQDDHVTTALPVHVFLWPYFLLSYTSVVREDAEGDGENGQAMASKHRVCPCIK